MRPIFSIMHHDYSTNQTWIEDSFENREDAVKVIRLLNSLVLKYGGKIISDGLHRVDGSLYVQDRDGSQHNWYIVETDLYSTGEKY